MSHPEIVVIGGGAAGIAAARRLREAGCDVLLVEAAGRLGGRAHSVKAGGYTLDLGCGWLHSAERNAWSRIALANRFTVDQTPAHWREQWRNLGFPAQDQTAFRQTYEVWEARIEEARGGPDRALGDFIARDDPWRPLVDAISAYANGAQLDRVSLQDWSNYEDSASEENWRVREGLGVLVVRHAQKVKVRLDTAVGRIDHRGPVLRLETNRGVIEATRVVVAVPTTVLADGRLTFDPPLHVKHLAAGSLPLGLADKLYLKIEGKDYPHNAHLIGHPRTTRTGSYQVGWLGEPVIECFFGGDCAELTEKLDDRMVADFAITELVSLLGGAWRSRLSPLVRSRWRAEPWIGGSYSHALVGAAAQRQLLAEPVEERIFFAGEACSKHDFSTVHGAYDTGVEAAEAVLAAKRRPGANRALATVPGAAPLGPGKPIRPRRRVPWWRRGLVALLWLLLIFLVGSVLWVTAYRFVDPPFTLTMVGDAWTNGKVTARWRPLDQIDPAMPRAAMAGEDGRFCQHNGFDLIAIGRAYRDNQDGGRVRGGSTISQQTAKNVFLWQGGGFFRKALEAWFTVLIEAIWGKKRIMEVYLNVAETGIATYGVDAGALRYFGHDAARLTPAEAARIAAVLPLPKKRPAIAPRGFVRMHGEVIARYAELIRQDGLDACLR